MPQAASVYGRSAPLGTEGRPNLEILADYRTKTPKYTFVLHTMVELRTEDAVLDALGGHLANREEDAALVVLYRDGVIVPEGVRRFERMFRAAMAGARREDEQPRGTEGRPNLVVIRDFGPTPPVAWFQLHTEVALKHKTGADAVAKALKDGNAAATVAAVKSNGLVVADPDSLSDLIVAAMGPISDAGSRRRRR